MLLKNKIEKIKSFLESDNVLANLEERYCYAEDASNIIKNTHIPDLVVFVETVQDVQKVLKYAYEHEVPIIARGAGTNMVGACVCNTPGIVLNFSKMDKILDFNVENMTVKVQPGVILGDLKKVVEEEGLFYPPDPSNYRVSTIGGSIAQSSAGAKSFKYGTTKDYILSLTVVKANGELVTIGSDTVKKTTGYHLEQLMCGSEGTLGIIVDATLKLIPKPETTKTVLAYFKNSSSMVSAVNNIIKSQVFPAAIDFMDNNSIKTIEDFTGCGLKTDSQYMLMIELDGFVTSMQTQVEKVVNAIISASAELYEVVDDEEKSDKYWRARCSSFSAATRLAPDVISDDFIVPRDKLALMLDKCNEITKKYNINVCLVGHAGDANIHPQFVLNLEDEEQYRNYVNAKSEMYAYVSCIGGTISAEHGVGLEKKVYLKNTIDVAVLESMKEIKRVFDPKNILNPGKIFDL